MKIVFMGTPEFAAVSLMGLIQSKHCVLAVFTQPDKPAGRKQTLNCSPVKRLAQQNEIPVFQPNTLKDEETLTCLAKLNPDIIIVVAYGKLLPKRILEIPPLGCINLHGSLLPKYRGAAPIQYSVLNGEQQAGLTTMYLAEGMDTGDMILQRATPIGENETSSELFQRLAPMGSELLLETLEKIENATAPRIPQQEQYASYAPMLTKEQAKLSFLEPAIKVHHKICGFSEWPCAYAMLKGKPVKIYHSALAKERFGKPGELLDHQRLIIACGSGAVELMEVQLPGKRRMSARDFINGRFMKKGEQFDID